MLKKEMSLRKQALKEQTTNATYKEEMTDFVSSENPTYIEAKEQLIDIRLPYTIN